MAWKEIWNGLTSRARANKSQAKCSCNKHDINRNRNTTHTHNNVRKRIRDSGFSRKVGIEFSNNLKIGQWQIVSQPQETMLSEKVNKGGTETGEIKIFFN